MPRPSGSSRRNMRPRERAASLVASSTEKRWTPVLLMILSVASPAACAGTLAARATHAATSNLATARRCHDDSAAGRAYRDFKLTTAANDAEEAIVCGTPLARNSPLTNSNRKEHHGIFGSLSGSNVGATRPPRKRLCKLNGMPCRYVMTLGAMAPSLRQLRRRARTDLDFTPVGKIDRGI